MVDRSTVTWVRIVELCFDDVCVCPAYACICVFIYKWIVFFRTSQRRWMFRFVLFVVSVLIGKWPKVVGSLFGLFYVQRQIYQYLIPSSANRFQFVISYIGRRTVRSVVVWKLNLIEFIPSKSEHVYYALMQSLVEVEKKRKKKTAQIVFFFRVFKATYSCKSIFNA